MNQESPNGFPFPEIASSMPSTDRAILEGLSKDETRAWALRKSEEYRRLSYTMLSLHNATAPIHTLPTEVLMKIFGQTWNRTHPRRSLALNSVCRRWHEVYLSTREFWADALTPGLRFLERGDDKYWNLLWDYERPPHEFVATLLDRSSPHLIELHIDQQLFGLVRDPTPPCIVPPMLFPHLNRVVTLYLMTPLLYLEDLHRVLNGGMASLETLHICVDNMEPPDLARTLAALHPVSDESLPRLRDLTLMLPIFFPLIAVESLEGVCLDCVQDMSDEPMPWPHPAGSDSRSLLQTLRRCPNLESLHLEDITLSRWWPPLGHGSGTLHLPSIEYLCFGPAWHAWALAALAALDPCIPSTAVVSFGPLDWVPTMNNLSRLMPSHLLQHHPFDSVAIVLPDSYFGTSWVIQCFAGRSLRLDIQFGSYEKLADLRMEDVFRAICVTHLKIIQQPPKDRDTTTFYLAEEFPLILHAFPHLTHLTATGADIPSLVVDALAMAGYGITPPPPPLCPDLRYLTLGWEMPGKGEFGPRNLPSGCDPATYRHHDVDTHVERRCSMMQQMFERRRWASMGTGALHTLEFEFYEYERQENDRARWVVAETRELIASSRRDDDDLPCLARLRTVVGGPVVYGGYLLKVIR